MPSFIALLRGVNVGKAKRVPMADLRALLTDLGLDGVTTLLNSGNAVFRTPKGTPEKHARAIAAAIVDRFGFDVPVIVKTARELEAIRAGNPFGESVRDPSRCLVVFVQDPRTLPDLAPIADLAVPPERFTIGTAAAYLDCPNGILKSKAGEALLGKVGRPTTTRNWATVLKLIDLAGA